jgi:hypothetical protein
MNTLSPTPCGGSTAGSSIRSWPVASRFGAMIGEFDRPIGRLTLISDGRSSSEPTELSIERANEPGTDWRPRVDEQRLGRAQHQIEIGIGRTRRLSRTQGRNGPIDLLVVLEDRAAHHRRARTARRMVRLDDAVPRVRQDIVQHGRRGFFGNENPGLMQEGDVLVVSPERETVVDHGREESRRRISVQPHDLGRPVDDDEAALVAAVDRGLDIANQPVPYGC